MRHIKLIAMLATVCLALVLPAVQAAAAPPPCVGWFPITEVLYGVMAHSDGTIWVGGSNHVFRYSRGGAQLSVVTGYGATSMAEAPGGDVYVLDYWGRTVNRYSSAGSLIASWPMALAMREGGRVVVDASGNVYVLCFTSGFTTSAIVKYDGAGNQLASVTGLTGSDGLALSGGQLYCSEIYGGNIRIFSPALVSTGTITNPATYGTGLGSDAAGNLMQPDYYGYTVHYLSSSGSPLGQFVTTGSGFPYLWRPVSADEASDHLYVVGEQNGYVLLFQEASVPVTTQSWGDLKATYR